MRLRPSSYRRLARLLLIPFLLLVSGCGTVRISGALNPSNVSISSGAVSFVRLTAILDGKGTLIEVTVVTLFVPPGTNTLTFCGNQASQFPMNSTVQVSFTTGQACSNLVSVVPH